MPAPTTAVARARGLRGPWLVAADAAVALLVSMVPSVQTHGTQSSIELVAMWVVALAATGSYSAATLPLWPDQVRRLTLAGVGVLAAGFVLVDDAIEVAPVPQGGAGAALVALLVATGLAVRQLTGILPSARAGTARGTLRVVVSGHRREVERIVTELGASRSPRYDVVAVCRAGSSSVEGFQHVSEAAARASADAVLVAPCRHVDAAALRRLGWQLERSRTRLLLATSLLDVSRTRTRLAHAGPLPLVAVSHPQLAGGRRFVKDAAERTLAALGLMLLLPVLLTVAVLVRLDSPGPALFRQRRTGKDGVAFTMLKFRTMHCDAEARRDELASLPMTNSILFKVREDPRTTRVGRILRRYSLDELPQLVNVVRGEMALVGPRPPLPAEVERYHSDVYRRLAVKPGITGLWQVSGRSDLSWEESVRLDLRYVDNWSLGSDVGILARTLGAVVHHRGAY